MKTYLPAKEFVQFHEDLLRLLPETKGREHADIQKMTQAMMLTRLELKRIGGDTPCSVAPNLKKATSEEHRKCTNIVYYTNFQKSSPARWALPAW